MTDDSAADARQAALDEFHWAMAQWASAVVDARTQSGLLAETVALAGQAGLRAADVLADPHAPLAALGGRTGVELFDRPAVAVDAVEELFDRPMGPWARCDGDL